VAATKSKTNYHVSCDVTKN